MRNSYIFESKRLGFRRWKVADIPSFIAMNANKDVMEFFPNALTELESKRFLTRIQNAFDTRGYGLYAVEEIHTKKVIGFIGFIYQTFDSDFTPCVEIGWRLLPQFWGQGYATEGAKACLDYGFAHLGFQKVYSMTAVVNNRSERVMQKIGMQKFKEFDHPKLEKGSWLERHVLYVIESAKKS